MQNSHPHLLVLRFSALGDVAMTLPVVYSAAMLNPEVRFSVVTRPFFARLFINAPENVKVVAVNPADYKGVAGLPRLLKRLRRLRPTAVADLHNVLRTWVIDNYFRMRGVKVVMVDKKRAGRSRALRTGSRQQSFIDRYCNVFRRLGLDCRPMFKSILTSADRSPIDVDGHAIGLAPFARYMNNTYPPEMMREVAEILCRRGAKVYLFGARGEEAEVLSKWAESINGCTSVAGRFTIEEELALMSKMRVICSMDSANQHLASLVGTPVVTLWGSTTPECGFTPYGQREELSMVARLECQPCSVAGKPECPLGHFNCMKGLKAESVAEKLLSI